MSPVVFAATAANQFVFGVDTYTVPVQIVTSYGAVGSVVVVVDVVFGVGNCADEAGIDKRTLSRISTISGI